MTLSDKVKFTLDEGRMLILGGQVLVAFGYQAVGQPGFERLPPMSQYLTVASLPLMLVGLALAMSPAARDCLVERGEPTPGILSFATGMIGWSLLPFAVSLGISVYVATHVVTGLAIALAAGVGTTALALAFWYGCRLVAAPASAERSSEKGARVELKDKINHALTETRMVLPGVQAMLGFQFIALLYNSFERLPMSSKIVHLVSLGLSAVTIIFLIAPAAFHRLVEHGEATERQHRVTTNFLLAAMTTLPPAITGDLFVILGKVSGSRSLAVGVSVGMLVVFYALWFGVGFALRAVAASEARHHPTPAFR